MKGLDDLDPFRWLYTPHVLIFLSSACIMIVEVVAGRLIARHLGHSLYTWTSVIGVVLAGMSLGNYVGGRVSDHWDGRRFLGMLFMTASAVCLATLLLNHGMAVKAPLTGMHWPTRILLTVSIIFLMPAVVLGTISPVTAKLALDRSNAIGTTLGSVYAWGAVGSIVGTLGAGFYLISALGSKGVVLLVAAVLSLIGLFLGPYRAVHLVWTCVVFLVLIFGSSSSAVARREGSRIGIRDPGDLLFSEDSHYQFVKVFEKKSDSSPGRLLRVLCLDHLVHGYVDLKDPGYLEYEYERIYREVAVRLVGQKKTVSAFFIGGGSYTFPRWLLHQWPGSTAHVAEIDPVVLKANHEVMGLPRDTPIKTFPLDARNAVDDLPPDVRYDLIFGDAFNDLSVPWHLTTLEFNRTIAARLRPGGAYIVNIIDAYESGLFLGALANTLRQVFQHVWVFCTHKNGVQPDQDTFVLVGSDRAMDVSGAEAGAVSDFPGALLSDAECAELSRKNHGRILTDDNAPVENLLEPVVRMRK